MTYPVYVLHTLCVQDLIPQYSNGEKLVGYAGFFYCFYTLQAAEEARKKMSRPDTVHIGKVMITKEDHD